MTQSIEPSVMQAAKRLMRIASREATIAQVYWRDVPEKDRTGSQQLGRRQVESMYLRDIETVLSVLPSGERPVAIEPKYGNTEAFGVCHDGVVRRLFGNMRYGQQIQVAWTYEKGNRTIFLEGPGYPTEADARLALHWQLLDNLAAASRASGTDQR